MRRPAHPNQEEASVFRAVLPTWMGYNIICFFVCIATLLFLATHYVQRRFSPVSREAMVEFNTAGGAVKPFLLSSAIVSSWTWATTLVQGSETAYRWGIAGSYAFASAAMIQIICFSMLAVRVKQCAPRAMTILEVIRVRYGTVTHSLLLAYAIWTNFTLSCMLVFGGTQTVAALTKVNINVANVLASLSVALYTLLGGLRVALVADYLHNVVVLVLAVVFLLVTFVTSSKIGSTSRMFDLLSAAAKETPVKNNYAGSYLTMNSRAAMTYVLMSTLTSFGMIFNDQLYWQRIFASQARTALRGYIAAGLAWWAIPFGYSTTLGLAAEALRHDIDYPTYPHFLSSRHLCAGLAAPAAAYTLLGTTGAVLVLVAMLFTVTTSFASELIAVSSVLTVDIYQRYLNPGASEGQLLRFSQWSILAWGCITAAATCLFAAFDATCYWIYCLTGVVVCSSVPVIIFALTWSRQPALAAILAPICGTIAGLASWICTAFKMYGTVAVATTANPYASLAGVGASCIVSGVVSITISLLYPQNFDFAITKAINDPNERSMTSVETTLPVTAPEFTRPEDPLGLIKAGRQALYITLAISVILFVAIPVPLYVTKTVFNKQAFAFWVACAGVSVLFSMCIVIVMPLVESRQTLGGIAMGIYRACCGRKDELSGDGSRAKKGQCTMVLTQSEAIQSIHLRDPDKDATIDSSETLVTVVSVPRLG